MQETGYRAFLSTRHVPSIIVSMTLARLPMGIVTLILVLFVSVHYGAAASGMATAAFTAGVACFGPVFGRLVDKGRGPLALRILGVAELVAILGLVGGVMAEIHPLAVVACSFAAGALTPPPSRASPDRCGPLCSISDSFQRLTISKFLSLI